LNTDRNNFAPRLGFAWSPSFGRQRVIRGGYGIYYGRTPSIMTSTATSNNGIQIIQTTLCGSSISLLPASFPYPSTLSALPSGSPLALPNLYVFANRYVQPQIQQASLGAEVQLANDWSAGASYLFVKGTHLSRSNNINLFDPVPTLIPISTGGSLTVLRFPSTRPASRFQRITDFQSNANSTYHGAAFTLNKRLSRRVQAGASYTVSKAIDDKPDFTSVVPFNSVDDPKVVSNPKNISLDRGLSDQDFRHRFVGHYIWLLDYLDKHENFFARHVLGHWSFSGIVQAQNGKRYSILLGNDPNNDGNRFTDRANGVGRNTNTLPAQVSFDIRVQHDFPIYERAKFQLLFEAFNLFNRPNFSDVNNIQYNLLSPTDPKCLAGTPAPGCLDPVSVFGTFVGTYDHPGGGSAFPGPGPRTLQLGVKFVW
jgi:hypothetical protein